MSTGTGVMAPGGGATVEDACRGISVRWQSCYGSSFDPVGCTATEACFRDIARDVAEPALLGCYAAWNDDPACAAPHCIEQVEVPLDAAHIVHEERCTAYVARCGGDGGDICSNPVGQLEGSLLDGIAVCFDLPCGELEDCVNERFVSVAGCTTPLL
jgi:hypothetical protein